MWFLLFLPSVLAHPFEAEFYGHQLDLELRREKLEAEYLLEIPMPRLADDVRTRLDVRTSGRSNVATFKHWMFGRSNVRMSERSNI